MFVTRRGRKYRSDNIVLYETSDITAQANQDYTPVKDGRLVFKGQVSTYSLEFEKDSRNMKPLGVREVHRHRNH